MTRDAAVLLVLTLLLAGFMLAHLALLMRAARAPQLPLTLRLLCWLPPLTIIAGWRAGARVLSLIWAALGIAYCVLRAVA
jgi:hypothetical protein